MPNIFEMFADYEIKAMAKKALDPYVAKGELPAEQEAVCEQACVDFLGIVAAEMLTKAKTGG